MLLLTILLVKYVFLNFCLFVVDITMEWKLSDVFVTKYKASITVGIFSKELNLKKCFVQLFPYPPHSYIGRGNYPHSRQYCQSRCSRAYTGSCTSCCPGGTDSRHACRKALHHRLPYTCNRMNLDLAR